MRHRTVRIIASAFVLMMVSAFVPGHLATVQADCNEWPSFLFAYRGTTRLDTRTPGDTINLYHWQGINAMGVGHGGDVMPNTNAYIRYINVATGVITRVHEFDEANDEGVIEQEGESESFHTTPPNTTFAVFGYFMDECGAGQRNDVFLGYVVVNP